MKKGIKRDLWFIIGLLGVAVVAAGLAWTLASLYAGPPPANQLAREHYAEGIKKLFGLFFMIGTGIVSVAYLWRLGWFTSKRPPTSGRDHSGESDGVANESEPAKDATLPSWLGWGILLGFVLIIAAILLGVALSPG